MKIQLVTPAAPRSRSGNRATAARWARFLRRSGHGVRVDEEWDASGSSPEVMVALHARRSYPSIRRYADHHPDRPLVVALTGTDLYRDIRSDRDARESLELATRLVVLQEKGPEELEPRHREKARVIYQSTDPISRREPPKRHFAAAVVGNLREEKDPFRAAVALRLMPGESRLRVTHAGEARDEAFAEEARSHERAVPGYRWLGEVPRWKVRRLLSRAHLLVQSSLMEGGANAVSEALGAGLPVIASEIPGNVGMLGEEYPGYYPAGDTEALARLLGRAEADTGFYRELEARCAARRELVAPAREQGSLASLVEELTEVSP